MQLQTDIFLYRLRFLIASVFALAFILALSAIVTAIGHGSILDARTGQSVSSVQTSAYEDSPNVVTVGASKLGDGTKTVLVTTGRALYSACRSVNTATTQTGQNIGKYTSSTVSGIGKGVIFIVKINADAVLFTVRSPIRFATAVPSVNVSSVLRPSEDKPVQTIPTLPASVLLKIQQTADQQKLAEERAAQLAANEALSGKTTAGDPAHGGYPAKWDAPYRQDSMIDDYGMFNRECVSYAAWKVYQTFGHMPYWGGVGNANQWPRDAHASGIATGSTPQVHSVAIWMNGYYGHAMWVEAVKGNMIYVSQYNYDLRGHYSEMWVNGSGFTYIYFK